MNTKSPKLSPTVVISKKDIVDENVVKSFLKSERSEQEVFVEKFNNQNLIISTPVSSKTKTRRSSRSATKNSTNGNQVTKKSRLTVRNDTDEELQLISEGRVEVSSDWNLDSTNKCEFGMDNTLDSLIGQEMPNPSDSFTGSELDDGKSRKKARKNPTPKRKRNKLNQESAGGNDDEEDNDNETIKNIKTPICLPKKRKLKDLEKSTSDLDSFTPRRTNRLAALKAIQKVKRLKIEDDREKSNLSSQDDDGDDEYVGSDKSKINDGDDDDDDEEFDDISLEGDGDSVVVKRESGRRSSGRDNNKKQKWSDSFEKDLVLKLRLKQQSLAILPDLMSNEELYKSLPLEKGKEYLPCNQKIKFRVQRKATPSPSENFIGLDLFQCHTTEDSFNLKIGGPLWSMDWCPTPVGISCDQYLALYTHQSASQTYTMVLPPSYQNKCLLQVWHFGKLSNKMSRMIPNLLPLLLIDGGPIWQMKWAPGASTWVCGNDDDGDAEEEDGGGGGGGDHHTEAFKSRIGLLACACHSGNVKIISIPRFKARRRSVESKKDDGQELSFFDVLPVLTLETTGSARIPCISVDWSISERRVVVAAGFADGAVALWNLSVKSSLLSVKKSENSTHAGLSIYPFKTFKAHLTVVSGVHFCPTDERLLLTCSHDKFMKVWNVEAVNRCLFSNRTYKITASLWPAIERSRFFAGFDEAYILHRNTVACYNFYESKVVHTSHCLHNGTINSISHREWSNVVSSCDNTGCVQMCLSVPEKIKGMFSLRKVITMLQVEDDDNDCSTETTCNCKSYYKPPEKDAGSFPISCCCNKNYTIKDFTKGWQFKNFIKSQTELPFDDIVKTPYSALHRVSWNTNKNCCDWIAFGGLNGLLRIRLVPDLLSLKK